MNLTRKCRYLCLLLSLSVGISIHGEETFSTNSIISTRFTEWTNSQIETYSTESFSQLEELLVNKINILEEELSIQCQLNLDILAEQLTITSTESMQNFFNIIIEKINQIQLDSLERKETLEQVYEQDKLITTPAENPIKEDILTSPSVVDDGIQTEDNANNIIIEESSNEDTIPEDFTEYTSEGSEDQQEIEDIPVDSVVEDIQQENDIETTIPELETESNHENIVSNQDDTFLSLEDIAILNRSS